MTGPAGATRVIGGGLVRGRQALRFAADRPALPIRRLAAKRRVCPDVPDGERARVHAAAMPARAGHGGRCR